MVFGNEHNETPKSEFQLNSIEEALEDIAQGKVVIVVDDEDRENEGDFVAAAELVSPEMINFMATHGRGLICTPLTENRCKELQLGMMVNNNTDPMETAFTVSDCFGTCMLSKVCGAVYVWLARTGFEKRTGTLLGQEHCSTTGFLLFTNIKIG